MGGGAPFLLQSYPKHSYVTKKKKLEKLKPSIAACGKKRSQGIKGENDGRK